MTTTRDTIESLGRELDAAELAAHGRNTTPSWAVPSWAVWLRELIRTGVTGATYSGNVDYTHPFIDRIRALLDAPRPPRRTRAALRAEVKRLKAKCNGMRAKLQRARAWSDEATVGAMMARRERSKRAPLPPDVLANANPDPIPATGPVMARAAKSVKGRSEGKSERVADACRCVVGCSSHARGDCYIGCPCTWTLPPWRDPDKAPRYMPSDGDTYAEAACDRCRERERACETGPSMRQ